MARRSGDAALGCLFVVIAPIYLTYQFLSILGWWRVLTICLLLIGVWLTIRSIWRRFRVHWLTKEYGDVELAKRLVNGEVWVGMTTAQLKSALGSPSAVDDSLSRSGAKEVWKYGRLGRGFRTRITVVDGTVERVAMRGD